MQDLSKTYKTINGRKSSEFIVEKSRFITTISHVESEDEAIKFIEDISLNFKDANHNCSAYIINESPLIKRYNDDGEPQGSAGLPMLSVLEKEGLFNIAAVVTRYFGGKLLGKGGLVRAYSKGISDTLIDNIVYKRPYYVVELIHSYELLGILENYINENKLKIIEKDYTDKVRVSLYIREEDYDKIHKDLINLTSGSIEISKIGSKMLFNNN